MKKEQWTVIGLLVLLAALEIARNAGISGFLNTWWTGFQTALNNASNIIPGGFPGIPGLPGLPGMGTPPAQKGGGGGGGPVGSNIGKAAKGTPSNQKPVTLPGGTGGGIGGGGGGTVPLPNWSNYNASQGRPF